jgi:hypothetical protein
MEREGQNMKSLRLIFLLLLSVVFVNGCVSLGLPDTAGDRKFASSYGYHPIDPLPVWFSYYDKVSETEKQYAKKISEATVLKVLPDETMRIAIGQVQGDGSITYGPAKVGLAKNSYVVILDYIKFTTNWVGVDITGIEGSKKVLVNRTDPKIRVPVYIGVGLRLTANVYVIEGSVDLGSLVALGAAANAKQVSGNMVVQTLGISGENVSGMLPMPSEINTSTIQAAILSLGAIKAKMYDGKTNIRPRAVGVYNNLGGGRETIDSFIDALLKDGAWLYLSEEYILEEQKKDLQ